MLGSQEKFLEPKVNVKFFTVDPYTPCYRVSLWVNFMARCGQKSDLSGLCGIGYWVWSIST